MSVINRMLLELDERHDSTSHHLPGMVRAVPAQLPKTSYRLWLYGLLIVLLLLVAAFVVWQYAGGVRKTADAVAASASASPQLNPALVLQPSTTLELPSPVAAPDAEAPIQPIIAASPTPSPSVAVEPAATARTPQAKAPSKAPAKFLLPARDEPQAASDKFRAESKPEKVTDNATHNIKSVSKEQQADFRYREALSLIAQGRAPEAQPVLEEALKLDPKNFAARQALLGQLLAARRYPQAEQLLQEGLRLNIAIASQASTLASIQLERGDSAAALATLEKYAASASDSAAYHGMHAAILQRAGRHAEAIQQFQAALRIQANQANWLMGLGISLQAEKRFADAELAYTRARANPGLSAELQVFIDQRLQQVRQPQ